ncbi:MAG TPA: YdcF family protein [Candidatus Blautia stercoravium]|nr:YdcF family protein [Candidatus Blautia stercoravium]
MAEFLLLFLGIVCILYFIGIALYAGLSSKFPVLWILLGAGFGAGWAALHFCIRVPQILLGGILCILFFLCCLFLFVEAKIVKAMFQKEEEQLDCLIVLGAQVKGTRPSLSLEYRIRKAEEYLKQNPETKAILSGGKGEDEGISEAECMYRELTKRGIASSRLIKEDQSVNTQQNIACSYRIWKQKCQRADKPGRVGIVTSSFHLYRGTSIARKKMDCQIYGIAAKSNGFLLVNYLVREFLGVLKDKAAGNL